MTDARSAARLWARATVRARWRSLVVLGLLVGVTAGLALATVDGARRTATAFDRLDARENAPDAVAFPSQVGEFNPDWTTLETQPEVRAVLPWGLLFGVFTEGRLAEEDGGGGAGIFAALDDRMMGPDNRPVVVAGRMFDPSASDEMVVDARGARSLGLEVGDTVPIHFYGPDQEPGAGAPEGPAIDLRVVGLVVTTRAFTFIPDGMAVASPGLVARHGDEIAMIRNADVVLDGSPGAVDRLRTDLDRLVAPATPVLDLQDSARRVETTTDVERSALLAMAAVLAGLGLVLVGQAVVRSATVPPEEGDALRALGFGRSDLALGSLLAHGPTVVTGLVAMVGTAAVASRWLPVGLAGELDPDRGMVLSPPLTVAFALGLVAALVGTVAATGARRREGPTTSTGRRDGLAPLRKRLPVAAGLGVLAAFPPRAARSALGLSAVAGAAVGVLGVVGVLTIERGLDDALDHPERAGVAWDVEVLPSFDAVEPRGLDDEFVSTVASVPGVGAVAVVDRALVDVDDAGVPAFAVRPRPGELAPRFDIVVSDGRRPHGVGEVSMGPATQELLGVGLGDEVTVGPDRRPMTVVGTALFPSDVHSAFDEGVLLDVEGMDAVTEPLTDPNEGPTARIVAVRVDGGDAESVRSAIADEVGPSAVSVDPAAVPPELSNLRGIRDLPLALGAFLAVLGVSAIAHALATAVSRRHHDYAVLRALGMTRRGTRAVLHAQGTSIALLGIAIGLPLGVVVGRTVWAEVARSVPLQVVRPLALLVVVAAVPVGLVAANVVAWWPARRLRRLRPAAVLRTEAASR